MADLSREETVAQLTRERAVTLSLMDQVRPDAREFPGIDGGEWSVKDLLGHLESWEEHLLNAFYAWVQHQTAPIHIALRSDGLDAVNAAEMERRSGRTYDEQYASTLATRQRLIETLEGLQDNQWNAPPDPGNERTMADLAGSLLGSDAGPFTHDSAHLTELTAFVEQHRA